MHIGLLQRILKALDYLDTFAHAASAFCTVVQSKSKPATVDAEVSK